MDSIIKALYLGGKTMTDNGLDYEWIDGLLYPKLEVKDSDRLKNLDKFGKDRIEYLHDQKFELYRELLLKGKLAEHCENIEEQADKMYEQLFQTYLDNNEVPDGYDFFARSAVYEQADRWAKEYIFNNYIYI